MTIIGENEEYSESQSQTSRGGVKLTDNALSVLLFLHAGHGYGYQ